MSRAQPSFFSSLMGEALTPAVLSGPDGRVVEANNSARALLGASVQAGAIWPCPAARAWPAADLPRGVKLWLAADERESHAKANFLVEASHEIRTPLNGILGMAGLLAETPLSPAQKECANAVSEQAASLLNVLNSMLEYARLESGRPKLEREAFDPISLMQSIAELLSPKAYEAGMEIAAIAGRNVPPLVLGDSGRVRQILLNLAGAALNVKGADGVVMSARVLKREGDNIRLRFEVRAAGAPADLPPPRNSADGADIAGFGSAIVYRLADIMGGEANVVQEPGKGRAYCVDLPFICGGAKGAPYPPLNGLNVIVATHSSILGEAIASTLWHAGALPIAVASPQEAQAAPGGKAGVILLDHALAKGFARPYLELGIPVIVVTPQEARNDIPTYLAAGCAGFLVKPLRRRSLIERVAIAAKIDARVQAPLRAELTSKSSVPRAPHPILDERETVGVKARILLAEDNPVNARIARAMLESEGHEVHWVEDGQLALSALETQSFDLVILDMRMPKLDGRATARAIRAKGGEYSNLPILALTAEAFVEDAANAVAAGVNEVLSKPVERRVLADTVKRWVRRKAVA